MRRQEQERTQSTASLVQFTSLTAYTENVYRLLHHFFVLESSATQSIGRREERGKAKMADAAADIEERGFSQTAKDLFSGAAGGIAQVLIGESHTSLFYSL